MLKNTPTAAELRDKAETLRVETLNLIAEIEESGVNATDEQNQLINDNSARVQDLLTRAEQIDKLPVPKPADNSRRLSNDPIATPANQPIALPPNNKQLKGFANNKEGREQAFKAGQWLKAVAYQDRNAAQWCRDHGVGFQNAMSGDDNAKGGVLVPSEMSQAIIDLREQYGVFRANSRIVTMSSDTLTVPRRVGGLTAYAVGENDEISASDKSWDNVELVARKWGVVCKYSSDLSEDAVIDLADDLASEIAYAFANKEDESGFNGDGTSTYHGIVGVASKVDDGNHAGSIATAATGNTAFSTLDLSDFNSVVAKLPLYARQNARWYISSAGHADSISRLAYAGGGNAVNDIAGSGGQTFLGYPVVFTQVLNSTLTAQTSTIVALFGDLSLASMMGSRRDITFSISSDRFFEYDQLAIKGTQRYDIKVHDLGDATTAGPIVALKTPAS